MAGVSNRLTAGAFVLLLVFSTTSTFLLPQDAGQGDLTKFNPEWVRFDVREGVYNDAMGLLNEGLTAEERAPLAVSTFGTFDAHGLELLRPVPADYLEPRFDTLMLVVSNDMRFHDVRHELSDLPGLAVREFIAPSGLLVQGTPAALAQAGEPPAVMTAHAVPIGARCRQRADPPDIATPPIRGDKRRKDNYGCTFQRCTRLAGPAVTGMATAVGLGAVTGLAGTATRLGVVFGKPWRTADVRADAWLSLRACHASSGNSRRNHTASVARVSRRACW